MLLANKELDKKVATFDADVVEILLKYPWHGNLRELKNVIKRAVLMSNNAALTLECFPEEIKQIKDDKMMNNVNLSIRDTMNLKVASIEAEKEIILNALSEANYNKSKAAKLLDIDRKTLYNKIHQYNIKLD